MRQRKNRHVDILRKMVITYPEEHLHSNDAKDVRRKILLESHELLHVDAIHKLHQRHIGFLDFEYTQILNQEGRIDNRCHQLK